MMNPLEVGALAKILNDMPADRYHAAVPAGRLIVIEDYVSAEESEDGTAFYWASTQGTGNVNDVTANADNVELVKTAAQMRARAIPTPEQLNSFLGGALLGAGEGFSVTETSRNSGNSVEISGQTDDGLLFAAIVRITGVYEVDF